MAHSEREGWQREWDSERERGVMPMHLDISALHFPGNRWKQCIKAPRGNPGHPGIDKAWPGSGGAGGHLFHALNRLPHPPSPRWAWLFVYMCVCGGMYLYLCTVWMYRCVTSLLPSVRGKGGFTLRLGTGFTGTGLGIVRERSHWLQPFCSLQCN